MARHLTGKRRFSVVGLISVLCWPAAVFADAKVIAFRFSAPPDCGTAREFGAAAGARLANVRFVPGPPGSPVVAKLRRKRNSIRAELRISLEGGRQLTRTLQLESCEKALDALAFVAAVALDPDAAEPLKVRKTKPDPTRSSETDAANGEVPTLPIQVLPQIETTGHRRDDTKKPQDDYPGLIGSRPLAGTWHASAAAVAVLGPAPRPLWGAGVAGGWRAEQPGWWSPSIYLGGDLTTAKVVEAAGAASFTLYRASLDLCPTRAHWGQVHVLACAQVGGGFLLARGSEIDEPERARLPWFAAGMSLRGELFLGEYFGVFLATTVEFPALRNQFTFDNQAFHQVTAVSSSARAGATIQFP